MRILIAVTAISVIIPVTAQIMPQFLSNYFDYSLRWKSLKVTWDWNPLNWGAFSSLPIDRDGSMSGQFEYLDNKCASVTAGGAGGAGEGVDEGKDSEEEGAEAGNSAGAGDDAAADDDAGAGDDAARRKRAVGDGKGAKFLGLRYVYKRDRALILLYDVNGQIAGLQSSTPKDIFTPPAPLKNKYYFEDGDYWTQTVYLVDPGIICGNGRSNVEAKQMGIGTGLWIQNGIDPLKGGVMKVDISERDLMRERNWGNGRCYWTMGQHYWYNTSLGMDCDHFVPFCLLYNSGTLTGFCFAKPALDRSDRYDRHITIDSLSSMMQSVPDCVQRRFQNLVTMHVYFVQNPRLVSRC